MFFDKATYISRRLELIKKLGSGIIIIPGNAESARNFKANTYFFSQDSTFLYYTGINQPDLTLVLDCDSGTSLLFGDEATIDHTIWMGPQESLKDTALKVGISKVLGVKKLYSYIKDCGVKSNIHYLPIYQPSTLLFMSDLLGKSIKEIHLNVSVDLIQAVISQREIKSASEIQELEKALDVTRTMHLKVMNSIKVGQKESNLLGTVESSAIKDGVRTAYQPIVSVQGQILHNFNYTNTLKKGQLLLGDFGGQSLSGYAGDITRTLPTSGKFTTKQKEVYQIVLEAQHQAIQMLKPEVFFKDAHFTACCAIVDGLKEIGLMKGDTQEAVKSGAHALVFPHGLGHMIGLDVHDMESLGENYVGYDHEVSKSDQFGLKSLRLGKRLKQGFTITVEPGIYFNPELFYYWKSNNKHHEAFLNFNKIESYLDFGGIRIEDEYTVTEYGSELIGHYIPKKVSELEQIIGD
ncbi:aminopeptidase P family protein [Flavobacteriaceae bacterium LMO-SS05]